MRLTTVLLLAFCLHLSAKTHSQEITLTVKNVSLKEIFSVIKKQTGYLVFYKNELLADSRPVSLTVTKLPLTEFLDLALKNQSLGYRISDKTIMLFEKAGSPDDLPAKQLMVMTADQPPVIVAGRIIFQGKPVAGASVTLRPGKWGIATGDDGNFTFPNVPPGNYTLEVSGIGYKKIVKKIVVNNQTPTFSISLEQAMDQVEEVVVTNGYSSKKTGELTGSVQKISGDDLRMGITTSDPVSLLKGRATGLYISEQGAGDPTSSGGQIFVRGQSSIASVGVDQANQFIMPTLNYGPLLVLDGVIMPNQNLKELVTPQEIEDVTILKDAAATAIYGSRAAAGVIVITTKRGKDGKARVTAEVKYGINKPSRGNAHFDTGAELYDLQKEYFTQDYQINNASLAPLYPTLQDYFDYQLPSVSDVNNSYDWQKYAFLTSNTTEVNVGASGGNDRTKYYMGATYYNEQSTGVNNGLIRKSFRLNLESKLTNRLTANVAINGIFNDGRREQMTTGTYLYQYVPWANPYDANGKLNSELDYKFFGSDNKQLNPLYDNQWNFDRPTSQLIFGSARLSYKINDWLSFTSTNSGNLNFTKEVNYIDQRSFAGSLMDFAPQGFLGTTTNQLMSYLTSNQLSFRKGFGDHSITALAAMEYGKTSNNNTLINVNNVQAGYSQISLATQVGSIYDYTAYGIPSTKAGNIEGGESDQAVYSLFGEAGYTYRKRYSLSGSIRRDASSAFGADRRYGTFWSGGAAWILSSEDFMKNIKAISNLKLRANYGTSGSQLGDNFLTQTLYRAGYTYSGQNGVNIANLANPDLRWEVTKTFSGGIDLGLFNRINATIDAYDRRSENLLQQTPLPLLVGYASQWQNVGEVRNTGLELLVNADIIRHKNFSWNASFNISFNKNRIIHVANDSLQQGFYNIYYLHPGEDINAMKAVKYAGVDPQSGQPLFEKLIFDANGHQSGVQLVNSTAQVGAATDPRQMQTVGSFQPKYFGGLTNTFTYKQFSLNILITFTMKYFIHDGLAEQMQAGTFFSYGFNQMSFLKNQRLWTHAGQTNATDPWLYYQVNTNYSGTDKYIHDGSNARLRSVRLSYSLSDALIKKAKLANCTFYVSGDNLYTRFSNKIVASDPEGPSVGTAQDFGGSTGSSIGIPRRYVFGMQVNF